VEQNNRIVLSFQNRVDISDCEEFVASIYFYTGIGGMIFRPCIPLICLFFEYYACLYVTKEPKAAI
jgi:hypothetical protein